MNSAGTVWPAVRFGLVHCGGQKEAQLAATLAAGKLKMLQKQVKVAIIDNQPKDSIGISDSSFSQGGLMIGPWAG